MKSIIKLKDNEIASRIHFIRGEKVMLDYDLAALYGVETRALKQAVRRNKKRFPEDFMFVLTTEEAEASRSQNVILKRGHNIKYKPYAFTEQGVAMLSGILNSDRAIEVNIAIMRTFVKIRSWMAEHKELARKIAELEKKYDGNFAKVFQALQQLVAQPAPKKNKIGFRLHVSDDRQ